MRYSHRPSQSSKRHLVIDGLAARFPLASCATAKAAELIVDALNRAEQIEAGPRMPVEPALDGRQAIGTPSRRESPQPAPPGAQIADRLPTALGCPICPTLHVGLAPACRCDCAKENER